MKKIFSICIAIICSGGVSGQDKGSMLIKNGTVITITKGTLTQTDVLVKDGKIAQIGKNIAAPQGVKVIDATRLFVMPGIIDAISHIAHDAITEATSPTTSHMYESNE